MLPLEGITVVALEHAIAAPFCTRQLADQGAARAPAGLVAMSSESSKSFASESIAGLSFPRATAAS